MYKNTFHHAKSGVRGLAFNECDKSLDIYLHVHFGAKLREMRLHSNFQIHEQNPVVLPFK